MKPSLRVGTHLIALIALTSCGLNLKMPSDFKVKTDLSANGLNDNIRSAFNQKFNPRVYRFLKDNQLAAYIQDQSARLNADCIVPTRQMVEVENQGSTFVFVLKQMCFVDDHSGSVKEYSFDINGSVSAENFKYDLSFEDAPQINTTTITEEEYNAICTQHEFF